MYCLGYVYYGILCEGIQRQDDLWECIERLLSNGIRYIILTKPVYGFVNFRGSAPKDETLLLIDVDRHSQP